MMTKRLALLALPLLALPAAAAPDPLAERVAGTPVECLPDIETRSQAQIVDTRTIAYSRTARRTWITHPDGACPGLAPFRTLLVERRGPRLCHGDRFRTVQAPSPVPSGYCTFGPFTPYDRVAR